MIQSTIANVYGLSSIFVIIVNIKQLLWKLDLQQINVSLTIDLFYSAMQGQVTSGSIDLAKWPCMQVLFFFFFLTKTFIYADLSSWLCINVSVLCASKAD